MREIKFRAWDRRIGKMGEVTEIRFSRVQHNLLKYRYTDDRGKAIDEQSHFDKGFSNGLNIMQYTGLKDKNGKEIYEGDICRWRDLETFNDEILEDVFVVVWNDEKLAWYTQNEDGNFGYDLYEYTDDRDLEVIGNIHENADLLEVE